MTWSPQARAAAAAARRAKAKGKTLAQQVGTRRGQKTWPEGIRKPFERTGTPSTRKERRARAKAGYGGHYKFPKKG